MKLQRIVGILETLAPLRLAESWDNVGLLLGDPDDKVERIMTCLTVTAATVEEAVREGADLVVSHHPILFQPTGRLTADDPHQALVLRLSPSRHAVYSAHTAYDSAEGGINDQLAERLGLRDVEPLEPAHDDPTCKLITFVPADDLAGVQAAVFDAGGGRIGEYSECSFRVAGTGTFFGSDATHPAVGQKGRREEAPELRLEVLCPAKRIDTIVAAMRAAHSYEEPAFDIIPLEPPSLAVGTGRVGRLREPMPLRELADQVKAVLGAASIAATDWADKHVQRVGIGCGAAASLTPQAVAAGCDVFLTGEAKMHDFLAAEGAGLALMAAGHFPTERLGVEALANQLAEQVAPVAVWPSRSESDPVASW